MDKLKATIDWKLMHDCGHRFLAPAPAPQPRKIVIDTDELGSFMSHNHGSDNEAFELMNKMVEAWKARHN